MLLSFSVLHVLRRMHGRLMSLLITLDLLHLHRRLRPAGKNQNVLLGRGKVYDSFAWVKVEANNVLNWEKNGALSISTPIVRAHFSIDEQMWCQCEEIPFKC